MDIVSVKVKCISKKETLNYSEEKPVTTQIEFQIPYNKDSTFFQLSGGTSLILNTADQKAADNFTLGIDYDILITPSII